MELFSPVSIINGLGPAREKVLNDKGLFTLNDFLYYFPRKHLDRTSINSINELSKGDSGTIIASVETFGEKPIRKGKIFQVIVSDGTGILTLSWFNGGRYIKKMMKIGLRLVIFGKVEWYNGFVITHPEFEILDEGENNVFSGAVIPIYPMTKEFASIGLEQRRLRKIIQTILDSKISIPDFFSLQIIKQYQLISLNKALRLIHFSKNVDELKLAIRRLKFDEHFFLQLLVALKKHNIQTIGTEAMPDIGPYFKTISEELRL